MERVKKMSEMDNVFSKVSLENHEKGFIRINGLDSLGYPDRLDIWAAELLRHNPDLYSYGYDREYGHSHGIREAFQKIVETLTTDFSCKIKEINIIGLDHGLVDSVRKSFYEHYLNGLIKNRASMDLIGNFMFYGKELVRTPIEDYKKYGHDDIWNSVREALIDEVCMGVKWINHLAENGNISHVCLGYGDCLSEEGRIVIEGCLRGYGGAAAAKFYYGGVGGYANTNMGLLHKAMDLGIKCGFTPSDLNERVLDWNEYYTVTMMLPKIIETYEEMGGTIWPTLDDGFYEFLGEKIDEARNVLLEKMVMPRRHRHNHQLIIEYCGIEETRIEEKSRIMALIDGKCKEYTRQCLCSFAAQAVGN